jgi:small subunit ribosomal protein S21
VATIIRAKKDEPAMSVIRRFKKQVQVDQILKEFKKKEFYVKPSQVRKEQKKEWEREKRRRKMVGEE